MTVAARSRVATTLRAATPPAVLAVAATVLLLFPPAQHSFYPLCPIHEYLHLECPGCGATRALAALLRGHFLEAMRFNAMVTLLLPFAAAYGVLCYCRLLDRKPLRWPLPSPTAMYAAMAVTVVFTVARNLLVHLL